MTTKTRPTSTTKTTTTPATIVEAHTLAGLLLATLATLGFVVEYVTVDHHTYPWGASVGVGIQVDDPAGVATFLGGLAQIKYDADGVHHYFYTGQWRGVLLHVGPLAA